MSDPIPHLLLVEDSQTQALRLQILFETEGWQVSHVTSAEAGLDFISQTVPDLIVVDFFLPGMQGDAFCRMVRMKPSTRRLPLLILTETESNAPRSWLIDSGANDYLSKSEPDQELLTRIRSLLARKLRRE